MLSSEFHNALFVSLPVTFFLSGTLVVEFFTFGKSNGGFDFALMPMQIKGDEGVAFLVDFADQSVDFSAMQEQFSKS